MKATQQARQMLAYIQAERKLTPEQRAKRLVNEMRGQQVSYDWHEANIAAEIRRAEDALMLIVRKHTDFATAKAIEAAYRPNPPA